MLFRRSYILHLSDCVFMMHFMCFSIPYIFNKLKVKANIMISYKLNTFGKSQSLETIGISCCMSCTECVDRSQLNGATGLILDSHTFPP